MTLEAECWILSELRQEDNESEARLDKIVRPGLNNKAGEKQKY